MKLSRKFTRMVSRPSSSRFLFRSGRLDAAPAAFLNAFFEQLEPRTMMSSVAQLLDATGVDSGSSVDYLLGLADGHSSMVDPQSVQNATSSQPQSPPVLLYGGRARNRGATITVPAHTTTPAKSPGPLPAAPTTSITTGSSTPTNNVITTSSPTTSPSITPQSAADTTTSSTTRPSTRSPADFRYVLQPGTGFTAPTGPQAAVGDPTAQGHSENAIARWDVVPYQTFTGMFSIGVVAFDISGIKEVDFSVNGGAWTGVTSMTMNPQTNVNEYTASLNAANFADGAVEVSAIPRLMPNVGVPRVLDSLALYANAGGSLTGGAVYVSQTGSNGNLGTQASPFGTNLDKALDAVSDGGTIVITQPGASTM